MIVANEQLLAEKCQAQFKFYTCKYGFSCIKLKILPTYFGERKTKSKSVKTSRGGGLCSVIGGHGSRAGRRISTLRSCSQKGSDLFPALPWRALFYQGSPKISLAGSIWGFISGSMKVQEGPMSLGRDPQ